MSHPETGDRRAKLLQILLDLIPADATGPALQSRVIVRGDGNIIAIGGDVRALAETIERICAEIAIVKRELESLRKQIEH